MTNIGYGTMNDVINADIDPKFTNPFIVAHERMKEDGKISRTYYLLSSFEKFLKHRNKLPHCHEILIDHKSVIPDTAGRLVFDFDIKGTVSATNRSDSFHVPEDFKEQIESVIFEVVEKYFQKVNGELFKYVWSTSQNPKKFSKHLTVKNLYFDDWIKMSKVFYKLFCRVWDEQYDWIPSSKLIDQQIIKHRGSLRMVGSSKINGYPLDFDDSTYTLSDSLIRIYSKEQKKNEQLVTRDNIISTVFGNVLETIDDPHFDLEADSQHFYHTKFSAQKFLKPAYNLTVYDIAFKLINDVYPGVFKRGKINGEFLTLLRLKPKKCLLSGKRHEGENAFLFIVKDIEYYTLNYGCYRFCNKGYKTRTVGCISVNALISTLHPCVDELIQKQIKEEKDRRKLIDSVFFSSSDVVVTI